jgi:hypothetical protein
LLPKEYKWESQEAKREKKKGRATGGIITGVKLGIKEKRQEKGEKKHAWKEKLIYAMKMMTIYRVIQVLPPERKHTVFEINGIRY